MATYNVKKNEYDQARLLGQGDVMNVYGTAAMIGLSSGAIANVYDGGSADHFMLYDKGHLRVSSGGYAYSTTVVGSGAAFTVHSATVVNTVVGNSNLGADPQPNYKARMGISSGAYVSRTRVLNGGTVITHDLVKLVDVAVSNGGTISGNGGQMSNVIVNSGGKVHIAGKDTTDGLLKTLLVYSGASVNVYYRGIIDDAVIYSGAVVTISSGGTGRMIARGGSGIDSGVIGTLNVFDGGQVWECIVTHSGVLNVSGGTVFDVHVSGAYNSSPVMKVYSKGYASGTIVDTWAEMYVYSGGSASATTLRNYGRMVISSGAVVAGVRAELGTCKIELRSGASASNVELLGEHASMTVSKGAYVEDLSVLGGLSVTAHVSGGGRVSSATVGNGKLTVFSGGMVKDAELTGDGTQLHVSSGGTVNNATVNGYGILQVSQGAVVDSLTVKRYGSAYLSSGGKITGDISIVRDAKVSAYEGSVVDMDISASAPGEAARLSGISLISGTPKLTITVSATQAEGDYKIASGAASTFSKTFTVVTDAGTTLGNISVGGALNAEGRTYRLGLASSTLTLTVAEGSNKPARGDFNGNGVSDILFQNLTDPMNPLGAWMDADMWAWNGSLGPAARSDWTVYGAFDFTGDGVCDIMFRSKLAATEYAVGFYDMGEGGTFKTMGWGVTAEWDLAQVGDFNGNGTADILWSNSSTGYHGLWLDGTDQWVALPYSYLTPGTQTVFGVGDVNGDGRDDILINSAGNLGAWDISGLLDGSDTMPVWIGFGLSLTSDWETVGAADFDGNGTADIVLWNKDSGYVGAYMNCDPNQWTGIFPDASHSEWGIPGFGDYNGDGCDDVLVRNLATGALGYWSGKDNFEWNGIGWGVDSTWAVIA